MILLCAALAQAAAEGEIVADRILHVVEDRVVTASDLAFEQVFAAHDQSPIPALNVAAYSLDQRLIDYAILRQRAGNTAVFQPTTAEVRARWEQIRAHFGTPEDYQRFLAAWGLSDEAFQAFLYSRLVVEKYIHRNVGLAAQAANLDALAYYEDYLQWITPLRQSTVIRTPEGAP